MAEKLEMDAKDIEKLLIDEEAKFLNEVLDDLKAGRKATKESPTLDLVKDNFSHLVDCYNKKD